MQRNNRNKLQVQQTASGSWVNVFLGIWMIISPYVLAVTMHPRALWNNIICGIVIALFALIRALAPQETGWSWANLWIGIWLIISPFVLAFANTTVFWNNIILGIIVFFAAWANARIDPEVTV